MTHDSAADAYNDALMWENHSKRLEAENAELRERLEQVRRYRDELGVANADVGARCTELIAEAAVMREAIEFAISCEPDYCPTCERTTHRDHNTDCKLYRALSSDLAEQARELLDVVTRAREFQVAYAEWLNRPAERKPGGLINEWAALALAYSRLVGAFAVYDDKDKGGTGSCA